MNKDKTTKNTLENFDIETLDGYETMIFKDLMIKGITKKDALTALINQVEGDFSQLSPHLKEIAEYLELTNEQVKEVDILEENKRLKEVNKLLVDALEGVIKVADRKTVEFDKAKAALKEANLIK